jgi:hypothetical protein
MRGKIGELYTLEQVYALDLPDSPFLRVKLSNGQIAPIQTSHLTDKELLSVLPDFKETWWRFQRITREYIPLFMFEDFRPIELYVDVDYIPDEYSSEPWVTPKGFPRER